MCQVSKKKFRTEYEHLGRVKVDKAQGGPCQKGTFTGFTTEGPIQKAAAAAAAEAAVEKRCSGAERGTVPGVSGSRECACCGGAGCSRCGALLHCSR